MYGAEIGDIAVLGDEVIEARSSHSSSQNSWWRMVSEPRPIGMKVLTITAAQKPLARA